MKRASSFLAFAVILSAGLQVASAQDAGGGLISKLKPEAFYTHDGAELLYRQGKYTEAEKMCKDAIGSLEKSKGAKSPSIAEPLIDLATVYMRVAKFTEAKAAIDRADSLLDKTKPDQALMYGRLGINKGWRLYVMGESAAADKVCADSIDVLEKNKVTESKDLAELINNLGLMDEELADKNQDAELMKKSQRELIQGWQMREKLTGKESPETAESLNNLGMHLLFNGENPGDVDTGYRSLQEALKVTKIVYGENHPETAVAHATVALAFYMDGHLDDAEKEIKIAMPMTEKFLTRTHPDMAYELTTYARIMMEQQKFSDAEKAFDEAEKIDEQVYGKTSPQIVPALDALKRFYDDRGDVGKSREIERRIESVKGKDI